MNIVHVVPRCLKERLSLIKSTAGETLVETLISTLIVSAVVLMLSTAIVTAARVNAKAAKVNTTFDETKAELVSDAGDYSLEVNGDAVSTSGTNQKVQIYEQNGYVFYKYGTSAEGSDD